MTGDRRPDDQLHARRCRRVSRRSTRRPPGRGRPPSRAAGRDRGPALDRRGHGRPVRRRGGVARAPRSGDRPARLRGRGRRAGPGRRRAGDRVRARASPATCSRPASRSPCRTSPRDARFGRDDRRADRLRAALADRGPARRRRGDPRRPRGPRQARRRRVRPARRRARDGLRPAGDGRDPEQPDRARHREPPARGPDRGRRGARRAGRRRRRARRRLDAIIAAEIRALDADGDDPLWALADQIALLRAADPGQLELVRDLLAVLVGDADRSASARRRRVR